MGKENKMKVSLKCQTKNHVSRQMRGLVKVGSAESVKDKVHGQEVDELIMTFSKKWQTSCTKQHTNKPCNIFRKHVKLIYFKDKSTE